MLRLRSLAALSAVLVAAACASSPQAAGPISAPRPSAAATPAPSPAASAAGVYDFTTSPQGTEVTGVVTVTMRDGRYGGSITTSATPQIPVKNVTVDGQKVTVLADSPDGEVVIEMTMDGMDFTGTWSYGGQTGTLRGSKRG